MVTKRQLGIAVIALAVLGLLGILCADVAALGRWGGFGPLQRIGLSVSAAAIAIGILLICRGNRPA